jgi:hypothetical protein
MGKPLRCQRGRGTLGLALAPVNGRALGPGAACLTPVIPRTAKTRPEVLVRSLVPSRPVPRQTACALRIQQGNALG